MSLVPDLIPNDLNIKPDNKTSYNANGNREGEPLDNGFIEYLAYKEKKHNQLLENSSKSSDINGIIHDTKDMQALYKIASTLGLASSELNTPKQWYYGVYIPLEVRHLDCGEDPEHVYTDKVEALKVMKQSKKARFKQFPTWNEAAEFSQHGPETTGNSCQAIGAEKTVPFKGPRPQDLVQFRKAIENGDITTVKAAIEENPRYLFSSGDTPSILQEGCRFNALHVAAKSKQAAVAELILTSVTSLSLLSRLFEDPDEAAMRSKVLLDLYLNTPDKSCNETPLHFAVKYGAVEVVELLTSYPECQRGLVNKFGATVKDLVCTRCNDETGKIKERILELLEERFFLPVLRYEDNSIQPRIGEPFSPGSPLSIKEDPLSPRIEMQAFAGPMTKSEVKEFRKRWRTPKIVIKSSSLALMDPEKGLERVGRNLATELKVPWREYWSFLDTFVDLASPEGLQLLEQYLKKRFDETLYETVAPIREQPERQSSDDKLAEVLSPISDLCQAFQACSIIESQRLINAETRDKRPSLKDLERKTWRKEKILARKLEEASEHAMDGGQQFSPLLCVERSCQVFGKRIASVSCIKKSADSLKDHLDLEVKHLQTLITGYAQDPRFTAIDFRLVHTRVAAVAANSLRQLVSPEELNILLSYLRDIDMSDGTLSDDEDLMMSSRESEAKSLGAVLKAHTLCLTQCLIEELTEQGPSPSSIITEADCEVLWSRVCPCACAWDTRTHLARARIAFRRKSKIIPKMLHFKDKEEESSVDESWRSCDDPIPIASKKDTNDSSDDEFKTPPSSPTRTEEDAMEDPMALPDTFIYPGERITKTDLAVLEAIQDANITQESYPFIYRWRHLVELNKNLAAPYGQVAPSPGAWHRKRLFPSSPNPTKRDVVPGSPSQSNWERITGPYTPKRSLRPFR